MRDLTPDMLSQITELLDIGIALTAEKNHNRLLERILTEIRSITRADAGTLYLSEGNQLLFKIIHNETLNIFQGGDGEKIELPPVQMNRSNVSSYVALTRQTVNIADVYNNSEFDFSGPRRYDAMTGYRSRSMLVLPLQNNAGEVIGVIQLLNAKDDAGEVIAFSPHLEKIVTALASQAAISISNMQYIEEINNLFHSFVQAMVTAIDARTPYNVNHTRNIAVLARALAGFINTEPALQTRFGPFNQDRTEQLVMAAWLHDIGKVAVPLSIMDKPTRLGDRFEYVCQRFDLIEACTRLAGGTPEQVAAVREARDLVTRTNQPSAFVDPETAARLQGVAERTFTDLTGQTQAWLTPAELAALSVARGTLTAEERLIMESHVTITQRILEKISFNQKYRNVPGWATAHHVLLDGTGYGPKPWEDVLPVEVRILTILDVYDALTASDRPYKRAMPKDKALDILRKMAADGKMDTDLVEAFIQSRVWSEAVTPAGA